MAVVLNFNTFISRHRIKFIYRKLIYLLININYMYYSSNSKNLFKYKIKIQLIAYYFKPKKIIKISAHVIQNKF